MIKSFENYLVYEKRYSPHTILSYKNDIQQFSEYIEKVYNIYNLLEVDHYMIRSWLVDLMQKKMTTKTINRKFSTLRTFFLFLKRENKIKTNPTKKVIAPKIGKRLPSIIQKKEINDLLGNTWFSNNFFGVRDKTIIVILYNT